MVVTRQAVLHIAAKPSWLRRHFQKLARPDIVGRLVVQVHCPECHTSVAFFSPEAMEARPEVECKCPNRLLFRYLRLEGAVYDEADELEREVDDATYSSG